MSQEVLARVENVFGKVFGATVAFAPKLARNDEPRWTSLKHVEFIIALEKEFGVRFDGIDATDMTAIGMVVDRVTLKLR